MNRMKIRFMSILSTVGLMCLPAGIVLAAAAEEMPVPPAPPEIPMHFLMLVILGLTLDVILMAAFAYLWIMWRLDRKAMKQITALSAEMKELAEALKGQQTPEEAPSAEPDPLPAESPAPEEPMKNEVVWKEFVEEFNQLAERVKQPGGEEVCEKFAKDKQLTLLMCLDHAAEMDGQPAPKFAAVQSVPVSAFWAYPLPAAADRYAVVPNPSIPYEKQIHEEGGMKETFASNFESGVCRSITVKMPALFRNEGGNWIIDQPGLLHVEP